MITPDDINPCDLNIMANIDKPKELRENQSFYCHVECFKKRLHDTIQGLLVIDDNESA